MFQQCGKGASLVTLMFIFDLCEQLGIVYTTLKKKRDSANYF